MVMHACNPTTGETGHKEHSQFEASPGIHSDLLGRGAGNGTHPLEEQEHLFLIDFY